MKTIPRLTLFAAAALGAVVFFSGCTTARTARSSRPAHFYDMTVMKSSGPVDLSTREMAQLRDAVIAYVQSNGELSNGAYYVEVKFKPLEGETEGGWVVVKLVERNVSDYQMIASSSDGAWPYYYDPFYNRYGYASFGNYPFDSFDYGYSGGYYPPRYYPRDHHRPDDNDHNHNDHPHGGGRDVAHNGGGESHPRHSGGDYHPPEPRHWESGGGSTASYTPPSSSGGGGSSYSPPPAPSNPEPSHGSGDAPSRDTGIIAAK